MELPTTLLDAIESGNAILFLGAGASFGAMHPSGNKIPSAQELSDMLANKYLDSSYLGSHLTYTSELAVSQSDLFKVQKFISDLIEPFKPADFHKIIPTFRWRSIYTTNYDLIIERAYDQVSDRIQDLIPVYKNTRVHNIYKTDNSLPYYKIHGCLTNINDRDLPLILTPDQYISHKLNRDRLFIRLLEECHDFTFIFVGYSFADIEIRTILQMMDQEKEGKPRYYMVGPKIKDAEAAFWEGRKISSIKMSFKDFIITIDQKISKQNRILSKAIPVTAHPIHTQFVVNINEVRPSASLQEFIQNDIDYIHSALTSPNSTPREFYKGSFNNWDPIIRNLDVQRKVTDSILSEIFLEDIYSGDDKEPLFVLIQGYAGSGKSVVLKRLAWDAAVTFQKFCIFYRPNTSIRYENVSELYNFVKRRIFIFVDNALSKDEEIKKLFDRSVKERLPITLVASERTNIWNQENNTLKNYLGYSYKIEYLNDREIEELLDLLDKHKSLGFLEGKPKEEQKHLLGPKSGRVLLVALYEATHGKPFRDIVKDEYDKIQPDTAKSLYLTVSILHMLGSAARAGLISRVHGINFNRFKEEFFMPLEFIVFDRRDYKINDYVYLTRHPYIAQMVFETVLTDEQSRFDEFIRILAYLDIDFDNDRSAFIYLTNAKRLLELFPNRSLIRNIYKKAIEVSPNNPKLLQQMAILEIETRSIKKAEQYISEANELIKGNDPIILHTFAEIEFSKAENSNNTLEKNGFLDKAIKLCDKLLKDFGSSPFSYHTILKSLNAKLELALVSSDNPTIERIVKDIERRFRDSKQEFPLQEFILEVEASFNQIVNNSPKALDLLIKAHEVNKSSPFIATRLSNIYEANGDIEKARIILNETLNSIPGDKDINFNYAMLLMKLNSENYKDLLYYLRKSFTEGDNRYQAQFWYARTLFLDNQIDESKRFFKTLSKLNIDPQIKNTPRGIVETEQKPIVYTGRIIKLELSYGFLKRDIYGDDLFISKYDNYDTWLQLKNNDPITFNIGFNYKGPVCVNVKLMYS